MGAVGGGARGARRGGRRGVAGRRPGSCADPGRPAPLGLTSVGGAGAESGQAVLADAAGGRQGAAALDGGSLPDGPDSAAVHRLTGERRRRRGGRAGRGLCLARRRTRNGPRWELVDGTRALRVATGAGAPWTYARDAATACLPMPGAGPDEPVSCAAVAGRPAPADGPARPRRWPRTRPPPGPPRRRCCRPSGSTRPPRS